MSVLVTQSTGNLIVLYVIRRTKMSQRDELILRIKNLAITPEDYDDSTELIKLMDY